MLIGFLNRLNELNENLFAGFDSLIEGFGMPDWLCDAIVDSFHVLPLLFIVFLVIEFVEFFYSEKINFFMKKSEKSAPLIGSLAAIIPQCGFCNCKYIIHKKIYHKRYFNRNLPSNF